MDFMPITGLVLQCKVLTEDDQRRFRSETQRLGYYMRRYSRHWPPALQPDTDDLEDLGQEVLLKFWKYAKATADPGTLGSGFVFSIVRSVLNDFLDRRSVRAQEVLDPLDETDASVHLVLDSNPAKVEHLKSHLRLGATKVAEEIRERLNMASLEGQEEFRLLTMLLLIAIEDPVSDVKDVYIAAQRELDREAGWTAPRFQQVVRRIRMRPTLRAFMRARAQAVSQMEALAAPSVWGHADRPRAFQDSDFAGANPSATPIDTGPLAGPVDDLPPGSSHGDV